MRHFAIAVALVLLTQPEAQTRSAEDVYAARRAALVEQIEADVRMTSRHIGKGKLDPRVLEVIGRVERHEFVRPRDRRRAYANRPLPIGHGQTISQPYIVALMTDLLDLEQGDKVLEIGTGSAYQAAVLAELVDEVHTIEIIEPLANQAATRLERLGYDNVTVVHADGYHGLPNEAPFDAIIVTAAAGRIPPPLLKQLARGGRMVIPVGPPFAVQQLMLVEKSDDGKLRTRQILPVRFVPLTGVH